MGVKTYTCSHDASHTYTEEYEDATAHVYGDLIAKEPASCTDAGMEAHYYCNVCETYFDAEKNATTESALVIPAGHDYNDNGECNDCHATKVEGALATFTFGANGAASNYDGTSKTSYSENNAGYTLTLSEMTNMYTGARDDKGNSTIKGGASSSAGSFSFTVPADITSVTIHIAKYGSDSTKVKINGTTYTLTKGENNGEYDAIVIDTTTTKKVSVASASTSKQRFMVNTIEFNGVKECVHTNKNVETQTLSCTQDGYTMYTCTACNHSWKENVVEATGHAMGDRVEAVAETCQADGNVAYYHCDTCGNNYEDEEGNVEILDVVIPKREDAHVDEDEDEVCDLCEKEICEHVWDDGVVTTPATCTTAGEKTYTCTLNSAHTKTESISATGHGNYSYVKVDENSHNKVCGVCEDIVASEGHDFTDGDCDCGQAKPANWQIATSIAVGDNVVIVCDSKNMELSGMNGTSYGLGTSYTTTPAGMYALTVEAGATAGTYAFKTSDDKYLAWSSSNSLKTVDAINANSSWTVEFDASGNAIIKNASDATRKLQWNASNPRFACYTSNQTAVQIYAK